MLTCQLLALNLVKRSLLSSENQLVAGPVGLWARGPRVWATCGPRLRGAGVSRRGIGAVHRPTRLSLGPVRREADSSTYPQADDGVAANTLAQGTRRQTATVDPAEMRGLATTGLHCVAELAFLSEQGSTRGTPV